MAPRKCAMVGIALGIALCTSGSGAQAQTTPPFTFQRQITPPPTSAAGALLERDLQTMRATSAFPNRFLYGKLNPKFETVIPPNYYTGPTAPYYPYNGYYSYPQYGSYAGSYNSYGSAPYGFAPYGYSSYGYQQYVPQCPIIQREVVIIREGAGSRQPADDPPAPRDAPPPRKREGDGFYLRDRPGQEEGISAALDDIRKAWLNGDFERMKARFKPGGAVKVFVKGQYRDAVDTREFLAMVKDAMTRLDTVAFELDRPKATDAGRSLVTGKHTWLDSSKMKQEVYVSYGLERVTGKWMIVEAGSSSDPITEHKR